MSSSNFRRPILPRRVIVFPTELRKQRFTALRASINFHPCRLDRREAHHASRARSAAIALNATMMCRKGGDTTCPSGRATVRARSSGSSPCARWLGPHQLLHLNLFTGRLVSLCGPLVRRTKPRSCESSLAGRSATCCKGTARHPDLAVRSVRAVRRQWAGRAVRRQWAGCPGLDGSPGCPEPANKAEDENGTSAWLSGRSRDPEWGAREVR